MTTMAHTQYEELVKFEDMTATQVVHFPDPRPSWLSHKWVAYRLHGWYITDAGHAALRAYRERWGIAAHV